MDTDELPEIAELIERIDQIAESHGTDEEAYEAWLASLELDQEPGEEMPEITEETAAFLEHLAVVHERFPRIYDYELRQLETGKQNDDEFEARMERLARRAGLRPGEGNQEERSPETDEEEPVTNSMWDTLAALRTEYDQKLQAIRQDERLSGEGRRLALAELYQEYGSRHNNTKQGAIEKAQRRVAEAQRRVLRPRLPEGLSASERETFLMSYRDAASRVADTARGLESPKSREEALTSLLNQADDSGDERLAEAAFHFAVLNKYDDVRDAYLESRPSQKRAWDAIAEATQEQSELVSPGRPGWTLDAVYSRIEKPPELSGEHFPEVEGATEIRVNPQEESKEQLQRQLSGGRY